MFLLAKIVLDMLNPLGVKELWEIVLRYSMEHKEDALNKEFRALFSWNYNPDENYVIYTNKEIDRMSSLRSEHSHNKFILFPKNWK